MCIAVHSDGDLLIDLMLESLHPVRAPALGVFASDQSFDLVVKNFSDKPISRLIVVHPRQLYPDLRTLCDGSRGDANIPCWTRQRWFGERLHTKDRLKVDGDTITFKIRADDLRSPSVAEEYVEHQAKLVDPVAVRPHPLIVQDESIREFIAQNPALPSILEVELAQPLLPYDRRRAPKNVYYVRLNLQRVPVRPIAAYKLPLRTSNGRAFLLKQVFALMAPQLVWGRLETRLAYARSTGSEAEQDAAQRLLESVVDNGYRSPASTVRIRDHRLAIVVPEDSHFDAREIGKLLPWLPKRLAADDDGSTDEARAQVWLAGPETFPEVDAESLARKVCFYLIDAAQPGKPASVSETGVAVACGCQSLENARMIIAVLVSLKVLQRAGTGYSLVSSPPGDSDGLAKWQEAERKRLRSRAWEISLRKALATAKKALSREGRVFDDQPFVLHFSVVSEAQDATPPGAEAAL